MKPSEMRLRMRLTEQFFLFCNVTRSSVEFLNGKEKKRRIVISQEMKTFTVLFDAIVVR